MKVFKLLVYLLIYAFIVIYACSCSSDEYVITEEQIVDLYWYMVDEQKQREPELVRIPSLNEFKDRIKNGEYYCTTESIDETQN